MVHLFLKPAMKHVYIMTYVMLTVERGKLSLLLCYLKYPIKFWFEFCFSYFVWESLRLRAADQMCHPSLWELRLLRVLSEHYVAILAARCD